MKAQAKEEIRERIKSVTGHDCGAIRPECFLGSSKVEVHVFDCKVKSEDGKNCWRESEVCFGYIGATSGTSKMAIVGKFFSN